jgi:hypothetical protein
MGFLTPLALAFAALSIPILILYMLKLRRRDVLVSTGRPMRPGSVCGATYFCSCN